MRTSSTRLLAMATLCSAVALGACAMDDTTASEGEQISVVKPDGITVNLSVTQWQIDLHTWQTFFATCRPSVTIDGDFGPMTTTATECFQRSLGLSADGVVGPSTFNAMCGELLGMKRRDLFDNSNC